jgi:hypothetical protein
VHNAYTVSKDIALQISMTDDDDDDEDLPRPVAASGSEGHLSIVQVGTDPNIFVPEEEGLCPLCTENFTCKRPPSEIRKHLEYHWYHSIDFDGRKHLICKLGCIKKEPLPLLLHRLQ